MMNDRDAAGILGMAFAADKARDERQARAQNIIRAIRGAIKIAPKDMSALDIALVDLDELEEMVNSGLIG
jgi:hypothetical protein